MAAVGSGSSPSGAQNVTSRGGELVAREAPGNGQAGIAVLRGSDRVQLLGERDGWSEILLSDKRRAWVPTDEITRIAGATRPTGSPVATPTPIATVDSNLADPTARELTAEIARLRATVDELAAWRANLPAPAESPLLHADDIPWTVAGAALILGLLAGSAWGRYRSRRDRSLRF